MGLCDHVACLLGLSPAHHSHPHPHCAAAYALRTPPPTARPASPMIRQARALKTSAASSTHGAQAHKSRATLKGHKDREQGACAGLHASPSRERRPPLSKTRARKETGCAAAYRLRTPPPTARPASPMIRQARALKTSAASSTHGAQAHKSRATLKGHKDREQGACAGLHALPSIDSQKWARKQMSRLRHTLCSSSANADDQ